MRLAGNSEGEPGVSHGLIDITRSVGFDTLTYPGDDPPELTTSESESGAASWKFTAIQASCHLGTHLDAPAHYYRHGKKLHEYPIGSFFLEAMVIDASGAPYVGPAHLEGIGISAGSAVLFRTDNAMLPRNAFSEEYCYLGEEACQLLAQTGVGLVGIDYLSVDPFDSQDYPAHRTLLGAGILILEDVDLRLVEPGRYRLYCLPLKLHNTEAAPCRAVLELI